MIAATPQQSATGEIIQGDALTVLRTLATHSVDAICIDPPAGISFMNLEFDSDKGGRDQWIAWLQEIMVEALRVIRPGGHTFVWALPRTSHWTATALENAGWEIREVVTHLYGSGFPKSHNVSIAIDKHLRAEREVIGPNIRLGDRKPYARNTSPDIIYAGGIADFHTMGAITKPATPEAVQWDGWGSALKPSHENWLLARAPLSEPNIAANVLLHGTGGINIDQCRIGTQAQEPNARKNKSPQGSQGHSIFGTQGHDAEWNGTQGRFPSNTLFSHTSECRMVGMKRVKGTNWRDADNDRPNSQIFGQDKRRVSGHYSDADGMEEVQEYVCSPDCPVRLLDEQSGIRKSGGGIKAKAGASIGMLRGEQAYHFRYDSAPCEPSEGFASRFFQVFPPDEPDITPFFYVSKPSRAERNRGCETLPEKERHTQGRDEVHWIDRHDGKGKVPVNARIQPAANFHPTVKPVTLIKYLISMITPPGGTVLDFFAGSGTTALACIALGMEYILVEQNEEYCAIAQARVQHALSSVPMPVTRKQAAVRQPQPIKAKRSDEQLSLWEGIA